MQTSLDAEEKIPSQYYIYPEYQENRTWLTVSFILYSIVTQLVYSPSFYNLI